MTDRRTFGAMPVMDNRLDEIKRLTEIAATLTGSAINREAAGLPDSADDALRSAAWRLADAAGILRDALAERGISTGTGISEATGRGFTLPRREF